MYCVGASIPDFTSGTQPLLYSTTTTVDLMLLSFGHHNLSHQATGQVLVYSGLNISCLRLIFSSAQLVSNLWLAAVSQSPHLLQG